MVDTLDASDADVTTYADAVASVPVILVLNDALADVNTLPVLSKLTTRGTRLLAVASVLDTLVLNDALAAVRLLAVVSRAIVLVDTLPE